MTPEEFRKRGYEIVDFIAEYRARVEDRPVMAQTAPGAVHAKLPASPPLHPERFEDILRDLDEIILPGLTHWQHPEFFGYFPCNADGNELIVYDPDHPDVELERLVFRASRSTTASA